MRRNKVCTPLRSVRIKVLCFYQHTCQNNLLSLSLLTWKSARKENIPVTTMYMYMYTYVKQKVNERQNVEILLFIGSV